MNIAIIPARGGCRRIPGKNVRPLHGKPILAHSIEIAIWAAVGGRGTLFGPILGAFAVNGAKSWFTVAYPEYWLYFLGLLFVGVTLLLPRGLMGLAERLRKPAAEPAGQLAAKRAEVSA